MLRAVRTGTAVILVTLLALATHLAYFAADRDALAGDAREYAAAADNLLHGRGFTIDGVPETRRTPGYPLFLAAWMRIGLGLQAVIFVQHMMAVAMASALFLLTRRMTGDARIALLAAILVAIDLPTIAHADEILTETLFTSILLAVFALSWRIGEGRGNGLAAGLLLGISALVRPISVAFFVPLALYFAWTGRRKMIPIFVAAALVLPSLWVARNYRATGVATLSSISGDSWLFYKAAGALAIERPGPFEPDRRRIAHELQRAAAARMDPGAPHAQHAAVRARLGREIVLGHPLASAKLVALGVAMTMLGGGADPLATVTGMSRRTAERLLLPYTCGILLLAMIGQIALLKRHGRVGGLVLVTLIYFVLLPAGAESYSRFRVPVVPMYAIATAAGAQVLMTWIRERRRS